MDIQLTNHRHVVTYSLTHSLAYLLLTYPRRGRLARPAERRPLNPNPNNPNPKPNPYPNQVAWHGLLSDDVAVKKQLAAHGKALGP